MMKKDRHVMKIQKAERRIRIRLSRLAAFLLVYTANLLLFLVFRGYFFLVTGLILTAAVPVSFYMAWKLAGNVNPAISTEKKAIRAGDANNVIFFVSHPGYCFALRSIWFLDIGNSFYETHDSYKLILSIPPRNKKTYPMPLILSDLGQIVFCCEHFEITDLLGIFSIHAGCHALDSFHVLPKTDNIPAEAPPETTCGVMELSESQRQGNDHSEVSDIRTYRPGDRPRDIHWKLSARQRELMVKERTALSGGEHLLLLELPASKKSAEHLLTEGYGQIQSLFDSLGTICLLVWNNSLFTFERYSCANREELDTAYRNIFQNPLSAHTSDSLSQYIKNCCPLATDYLRIAKREETIQLETIIND